MLRSSVAKLLFALVGGLTAVMLLMAAPQAIIEVSRVDAERAYRGARRVLEETVIPGRPSALRDITDAWAAAEYQRSLVDDQMRTPMALRDVRLTRRWRDAVRGSVEAVNDASVAIDNVIRLKEPVVAELAHVRRQAWAIRDAYGEQCSLLRPFVVTGARPDTAASSEWNMRVGAYRSGWAELDAYLQRPAADRRLRHAAQRRTGSGVLVGQGAGTRGEAGGGGRQSGVLAEVNADSHRLIDDTTNTMRQRAEATGLRFVMARWLHVRYVTARGQESASSADTGQDNLGGLPGKLAKLDEGRRNVLRMALETGELAAIAQAIDDVSKAQPDLIAVLHWMAREFRFHGILDAIATTSENPFACQ